MGKRLLIMALALLAASAAYAQSAKDLQINEVMIENTSGYMDAYGNRGPWIEIMNLGFYKVNAANYYLTNDTANPRMYRIPAGDPITNLAQRHFIVFFANGEGHVSPQHTNFRLDSTHRFVALYSPDGRTLIDSVTVPLMGSNASYRRLPNGNGAWAQAELPTPLASNDTHAAPVSTNERFKAVDPHGFIMAITAMCVVFTALLVLYRIFRLVGNINQGKAFKRKPKASPEGPAAAVADVHEVPGEVFAAISAALYQYENEQHDQESEIITIERVSRRYSPWSSKIYGLRQMPDHKRNQR